MIYTYENAPGSKVYDENGQEIKRVLWVDTDRNVIAVLDDPPKHNAARTDVIEHEIAFELIDIPKLELLDQRTKFVCYGRKP